MEFLSVEFELLSESKAFIHRHWKWTVNEAQVFWKRIEAKRSKGLALWMKEFEPEHLAEWDISNVMSVYLCRAGISSPGKF